jgi:hypothetical protein
MRIGRTVFGKRGWILAVPVAVLCAISIFLSALYAWNLAGPYEFRLSYSTSVKAFTASGMLALSTYTTFRVLGRDNQRLIRRRYVTIVGLLFGVPPGLHYLSFGARHLMDFSISVVALAATTCLVLVSHAFWQLTKSSGREDA